MNLPSIFHYYNLIPGLCVEQLWRWGTGPGGPAQVLIHALPLPLQLSGHPHLQTRHLHLNSTHCPALSVQSGPSRVHPRPGSEPRLQRWEFSQLKNRCQHPHGASGGDDDEQYEHVRIKTNHNNPFSASNYGRYFEYHINFKGTISFCVKISSLGSVVTSVVIPQAAGPGQPVLLSAKMDPDTDTSYGVSLARMDNTLSRNHGNGTFFR